MQHFAAASTELRPLCVCSITFNCFCFAECIKVWTWWLHASCTCTDRCMANHPPCHMRLAERPSDPATAQRPNAIQIFLFMLISISSIVISVVDVLVVIEATATSRRLASTIFRFSAFCFCLRFIRIGIVAIKCCTLQVTAYLANKINLPQDGC